DGREMSTIDAASDREIATEIDLSARDHDRINLPDDQARIERCEPARSRVEPSQTSPRLAADRAEGAADVDRRAITDDRSNAEVGARVPSGDRTREVDRGEMI